MANGYHSLANIRVCHMQDGQHIHASAELSTVVLTDWSIISFHCKHIKCKTDSCYPQ